MIRMGEIAFGLRVMSAGIDRINSRALDRERSDNCILYGFKFSPAIITSADARLVSHHYDSNAVLVGGRDDFGCAWNDMNVFDPMQIAFFLYHGPIAIQE